MERSWQHFGQANPARFGSSPNRKSKMENRKFLVAAVAVAVVGDAGMAVEGGLFVEDCDEHGGDVLEAVFALDAGEDFGVAAEFVGDLVDDEGGLGVRGEGVV